MPRAIIRNAFIVTFIEEYDVGSTCFSASYLDEGDITMLTSLGVKLYKRSHNTVEDLPLYLPTVKALAAKFPNNYLLHEEDGVYKVSKTIAYNMKMGHELFTIGVSTWLSTQPLNAQIIVSDRHVVALDPDPVDLVIFDITTKKTFTIESFPSMINTIHFLPSGALMAATKGVSGKLIKYVIEHEKLKKIWQCDRIPDGSGICSDPDGHVYVHCGKQIIVVSGDGRYHTIHLTTHSNFL